MEDAYRKIITECGEDLDRAGLVDTPKRAAKAMEFLTQGYHQDLDTVINNALFPSDSREMVIVKDIELYSMCEHHLLPFIGKCHVAYIPNGKVLGRFCFKHEVQTESPVIRWRRSKCPKICKGSTATK